MTKDDFYDFAQGYAKAFVSMGKIKPNEVDAFVQGMISGSNLKTEPNNFEFEIGK